MSITITRNGLFSFNEKYEGLEREEFGKFCYDYHQWRKCSKSVKSYVRFVFMFTTAIVLFFVLQGIEEGETKIKLYTMPQ